MAIESVPGTSLKYHLIAFDADGRERSEGGDLASRQPEIRNHEPESALDGGPDGLDVVRRLVPEAAGRLRPGGWLLFEFGFGQADGVRAIVAAEPALDLVDLRADLAGIPRVAVVRRNELVVARPAPGSEYRSPESRIPPLGSAQGGPELVKGPSPD